MRNLALTLLAMVICACFYLLRRQNGGLKGVTWIVYGCAVAYSLETFFSRVAWSIRNFAVWDFVPFYLYGKVGVSGLNYYLPASFHSVFDTLRLPALNDSLFVREIVDVGFLYPPPTILLFSPLGMLPYRTALILWTAVNIAFALGCVYLLYDPFLRKYGINGLLLAAALFLLLSPVRQTVGFSQTNFILLFLLLQMRKHQDKPIAGLLWALAAFVKPFMIVFGLAFVLRRQWKALACFCASEVALVGATLILFGKAPFVSYITDNPAKRLPSWAFVESVNQSLQAVLLRAHLPVLAQPSVYVLLSIALLVACVGFLWWLVKEKLYDCMWAVLLLTGLILYPGTLSHYGVLLAFIVFQFFDEDNQLGFPMYAAIGLTGAVYYLTSVSLFASLCFLFLVVIWKARRHSGLNYLTVPSELVVA